MSEFESIAAKLHNGRRTQATSIEDAMPWNLLSTTRPEVAEQKRALAKVSWERTQRMLSESYN